MVTVTLVVSVRESAFASTRLSLTIRSLPAAPSIPRAVAVARAEVSDSAAPPARPVFVPLRFTVTLTVSARDSAWDLISPAFRMRSSPPAPSMPVAAAAARASVSDSAAPPARPSLAIVAVTATLVESTSAFAPAPIVPKLRILSWPSPPVIPVVSAMPVALDLDRAAAPARPCEAPATVTPTLTASALATEPNPDSRPRLMAPLLTIRSSPAPPSMPTESARAPVDVSESPTPAASPCLAIPTPTETPTDVVSAFATP